MTMNRLFGATAAAWRFRVPRSTDGYNGVKLDQKDLAHWGGPDGSLSLLALWGLPAAVAAVSLILTTRMPWLFLLAAAAFTIMGGACVVNAMRCHRLHCYITGPYFLVLALGSALTFVSGGDAPQVVRGQLLLLGLALSPLLVWLPERVAGRKYRDSSTCEPQNPCQR